MRSTTPSSNLGGAYPLPRAEIAKIVDAIARLEPRVIAIDLLLLDKGPADGDAKLAKSIAAHPTVLAAAAVFPNTVQPSAETDEPLARLPIADRFLLPLPAFSERAEVGIANVATGQNGTPLAVPMLFRTHDRIELSFPLRVASIAIGQKLTIGPDRLKFGDRPIATASDYALPISYYGPRRTIRTVSAANLLDGQIDKEAIQGRIIVLGATATGAGDFFPTPFNSLMPGVEIISTAITHLVAGDGVVRDGTVRVVEAITTILLPILLVGLLMWRRNAVGLLTVSAVMLAWAAANAVAFTHGISLDTATTMAAAVPPVVLFGALQLWSGRRSARSRRPKQAARTIPDAGPAGMADARSRLPAGAGQAECRRRVRRPVRIYRAQRNARSGCDAGAAEGVSRLGRQGSDEVRRHDHEFPRRRGDHPVRPARKARPMTLRARRNVGRALRQDRALDRDLAPGNRGSIDLKIGADVGLDVGSRLGGRNHQHITATGDTVNVASRLMEVAARHDVRLALSDTLRVAAERIGARLKTGSLAGPVESQFVADQAVLGLAVPEATTAVNQRTHPDADNQPPPYCSPTAACGQRLTVGPVHYTSA